MLAKTLPAVLLLAIAAMWLPACDNPTESAANNLVVRLTDAPSDELSEVNIFFVDLTVKRRGSPVEHNVPLVLGPDQNPINILALADTVITMAAGSVEPGTYEFIHVNVDGRRSHVIDKNGAQLELRVPSEKVKILGPFEVTAEGTMLTLDFDADKSLVKLGPPNENVSANWLLKPVIVIAQVN